MKSLWSKFRDWRLRKERRALLSLLARYGFVGGEDDRSSFEALVKHLDLLLHHTAHYREESNRSRSPEQIGEQLTRVGVLLGKLRVAITAALGKTPPDNIGPCPSDQELVDMVYKLRTGLERS